VPFFGFEGCGVEKEDSCRAETPAERGDYSAFEISDFGAAKTFANSKNLDIDNPYANSTNGGKGHGEALKAILGPHGIKVLIKDPKQP
jgi:hypothetical protein